MKSNRKEVCSGERLKKKKKNRCVLITGTIKFWKFIMREIKKKGKKT